MLLVVLGFLAALASLAGGLVSVAVTSCSFDSSSCLDWVIAGTAVAVLAPPVCWVAALVASIVAMVRRRRAVWIPLAGVMAWVGLVAIALLVAGLGAGG